MQSGFIHRASDVFAQADQSIARRQGGLGLPRARSLAGAHGGTRRPVPATGPGVGATFTVTLPLVVAA